MSPGGTAPQNPPVCFQTFHTAHAGETHRAGTSISALRAQVPRKHCSCPVPASRRGTEQLSPRHRALGWQGALKTHDLWLGAEPGGRERISIAYEVSPREGTTLSFKEDFATSHLPFFEIQRKQEVALFQLH